MYHRVSWLSEPRLTHNLLGHPTLQEYHSERFVEDMCIKDSHHLPSCFSSPPNETLCYFHTPLLFTSLCYSTRPHFFASSTRFEEISFKVRPREMMRSKKKEFDLTRVTAYTKRKDMNPQNERQVRMWSHKMVHSTKFLPWMVCKFMRTTTLKFISSQHVLYENEV